MRKYLAPSVAVVLVGLVVWSYIHFKDYRPVGANTQLIKPPGILLEVEGIKLAGRSKGRPIWRMDADRLMFSQNQYVTTVEGIHGGAIYQDGKPAASVKAGRASYDSIRHSLDASGGVSINTKDGTMLKTTELTYDDITKRISCPKKVSIVRGTSRGSVDKMVADLGNDTVEADNLRMRIMTKDIDALQR